MTDKELSALEVAAQILLQNIGYGEMLSARYDFESLTHPKKILDLLEDARELRRQRDYLISSIITLRPPQGCPNLESYLECPQDITHRKRPKCFECVLKAVKNRPCQKRKGKRND